MQDFTFLSSDPNVNSPGGDHASILALHRTHISNNAGTTAPSPTLAHMWWPDEAGNRLRRRNAANDAWIDCGPLDGGFGDATSANIGSPAGTTEAGYINVQKGYLQNGADVLPGEVSQGSLGPHGNLRIEAVGANVTLTADSLELAVRAGQGIPPWPKRFNTWNLAASVAALPDGAYLLGVHCDADGSNRNLEVYASGQAVSALTRAYTQPIPIVVLVAGGVVSRGFKAHGAAVDFVSPTAVVINGTGTAWSAVGLAATAGVSSLATLVSGVVRVTGPPSSTDNHYVDFVSNLSGGGTRTAGAKINSPNTWFLNQPFVIPVKDSQIFYKVRGTGTVANITICGYHLEQ